MTGENQRVDAPRTPAAPGPAPAAPPGGDAPWRPVPPARVPVPPSRARRLAAPVLTLAGAVAAFAYVGTVDPNEPGHYPLCPMLRLTGVLCPGCGGLRSAHAFAHGDLAAALGANAVAVAKLPRLRRLRGAVAGTGLPRRSGAPDRAGKRTGGGSGPWCSCSRLSGISRSVPLWPPEALGGLTGGYGKPIFRLSSPWESAKSVQSA